MDNENGRDAKKPKHGNDGNREVVSFTTIDPIYLLLQHFIQHCNTVYTGTKIRVWYPFTESPEGRVASVYWKCNQGVYFPFDDTDTCEFIKFSKRHI